MSENKTNDPIEKIEKTIENLNNKIGKENQKTLKKYPVIFSLLIIVSFTAVLQGFEMVFDKIVFIQDKPWILILGGLFILIFTGSLYKILNN